MDSTEKKIGDWKKRAILFYNNKIAVHLRLRDGTNLGGNILRIYSDASGFDVDDVKLGCFPINYEEIEKFTKLRGEEDK